MESSSSSSSSSFKKSRPNLSRESFLSRVIRPEIEGKSCPICLGIIEGRRAVVLASCMHAYCEECIRKWSSLKRRCPLCNAQFDSWFSKICFFSRSFSKVRLPALDSGKTIHLGAGSSPMSVRRLGQVTRARVDNYSSREKPVPWRRSFGRPGSVSADVIAQRKLQWRASIYHGSLQAVRFANRNPLKLCERTNCSVKEGIVQRIEPWIRRELLAILGGMDPSVIICVATSLFITHLEALSRTPSSSSGQIDVEDDFLAPLRPFLHDRTDIFWHELRCFAESSFSMETYDQVVEYRTVGYTE